MIVGITQRIDYIEENNETRDSIDHLLVKWIKDNGYSPILIPNIFYENNVNCLTQENKQLEQWLADIKPKAILLSGGNDIGEYPQRDHTES